MSDWTLVGSPFNCQELWWGSGRQGIVSLPRASEYETRLLFHSPLLINCQQGTKLPQTNDTVLPGLTALLLSGMTTKCPHSCFINDAVLKQGCYWSGNAEDCGK